MIRNAMRLLVLALAMACALPAGADYEAGRQAWEAGRPDEALAQWRAAADAGDRRAMRALGRLYARGLGAPQDYVEAHKWFNLAASRGEAAALEERDALAAKMTPQQVQAAQALARSWRPGGGGAAAAGTPATGEAAPAPAADAGAPPPRAIREAQGLLAELGYAPGPADGVWGRRTARAYLSFLEAAGLPPAEWLTPEALRAMRVAAKRAGVAPGGAAMAARAPAGLPPDALHRAAQAGNVAGLQAALAAGADVDARDGRGWTALMYAVDKGYTLLVEPLLGAGANPDVRAPDGATALFMAVAHGHTDVIALLMEAGADPKVKGPKGKTAVDVARTRYGDAEAAMANDEPSSIIALLQGRTQAQVEEDIEEMKRLITLKTQCSSHSHGDQCWREMTNPPGCLVFDNNYSPDQSYDWSGGCFRGIAVGDGVLSISGGDQDFLRTPGWRLGKEYSASSSEQTGTIIAGKRSGEWVERYDNGWIHKGSYRAGKREGYWESDKPDGSRNSMLYVGGRQHGKQTVLDLSNPGRRMEIEINYKEGKLHGRYQYRDSSDPYVPFSEKTRWRADFEEGLEHGFQYFESSVDGTSSTYTILCDVQFLSRGYTVARIQEEYHWGGGGLGRCDRLFDKLQAQVERQSQREGKKGRPEEKRPSPGSGTEIDDRGK